jgi:hypothetical protein
VWKVNRKVSFHAKWPISLSWMFLFGIREMSLLTFLLEEYYGTFMKR